MASLSRILLMMATGGLPCNWCKSKFLPAFYHQIMDCLPTQLPMLYKANESRRPVCLEHSMRRWAELFPGIPSVCEHGGINKPTPSKCGFNCSDVCTDRHLDNKMLMNLARPVAQTYTVLISRKNTRKWANEEHILRQISLVTPVKIYTGDETLSDTIQLFHGANAVIGYHGAGLANAVFCQNGTKIIEVSVALPSGKRWRSNVEMVTKYGKFQQFQILMPFEKLAEANNKTLEDIKTDLIMTPKVHFDYYVKDLQWVMADDEVLTKIDAAIKK